MTPGNKINRQYGLWDSPISPISLARRKAFSDILWDESGPLVWREQRSDRGVIVVQPPDGQAARDLNGDFSVRARVGYGGGDFTVGNGLVFFVEAESGRIYRQPTHHGAPHPITPAFGRAASPALSPDGRWLLFVHSYERRDHIAMVDSLGEHWPAKLVSGDDFYMQPCWNPQGDRIAWIAWNHPNMPWDGTYLRLATVVPPGNSPLPTLTGVAAIAGGDNISIFQPAFSPDGRNLAYASDETGWWQLYIYDLEKGQRRQLTDEPAEHAAPAWGQGMRTHGFSQDGKKLYFIRNQRGFNSLWQATLEGDYPQQPVPLDEIYTGLDQISISPAGSPERIALIASGPTTPPRVITFDHKSGVHVWRRSATEELSPQVYSPCRSIEWKGMDGEAVHGIFFPAHHASFESSGKPPLIVAIHGGPTSQRLVAFNPDAQFFASRGYAYLEVNYRGSTGYGRAYRNTLRSNWGIYDVQDAVSGARSLAAEGLVDEERLVITGGSAGGFTVLKALEDYPGVFKAGICLYGVSDQFGLVAETHKFEERYSDSLLGPLPEAANIYRERSPINFAGQIKDPIAIFQGEIDEVVPRSQSDKIVDSLRQRGVPHEYHLYPGEGHGFRKVETIEHYYQAVEKFLKQYVIFA